VQRFLKSDLVTQTCYMSRSIINDFYNE